MFLFQGFKIRLHNREMNIFNVFDCLQLNDDSIIYNEIESVSSDFNTIIFDDNFSLPFYLEILLL